MKQNPKPNKQPEQNFTVLSFSSAPNDSFQFPPQTQQQTQSSQGYRLIITFIVLGFYFLIFGIIQLSTNFNQVHYEIELVRNGREYVSKNTFLSFAENTQVFVYLEIRGITQFDAVYGMYDDDDVICGNYATNQQMKKNISIIGTLLDPLAPAIPCGKFAYYYPQGQFQIAQTSTNKTIYINEDSISHDEMQMSHIDQDPSQQWASYQNQRFRNWMSMDAQQKVKNLWGRISDVVSGVYQIKLTVNNYMSQVQEIYVTLNNNKALAGYNDELCYLNFGYAGIVFLAALGSFLIQKKWGHRKVLKKKGISSSQSNQIKIFLNSAATTPAVKFD